MIKIIGFTGSRAEYYLQRPVFKRLNERNDVELSLIVSGGIIEEEEQVTMRDILLDGIAVVGKIPLIRKELSRSQNREIGHLIIDVDDTLRKEDYDAAIVYADRYESFAFAIAAFYADLVLIHIEAGDITEGGTYDDSIRHCITKLAHLQLTSTLKGRQNLKQLGEEEWRSERIGLLSYETLKVRRQDEAQKTLQELGLSNKHPLILVTMHPVPIDLEQSIMDTMELMKALSQLSREIDISVVVTAANTDKGGEIINQIITEKVKEIRGGVFIETLGGERYHNLLSLAKNMCVIVCGNSSSVVKEAPYYKAHGLNIGKRQRGREAASSQTNLEEVSSDKIMQSIRLLINKKLSSFDNPYLGVNPSEQAVDFIVSSLAKIERSKLLLKKWPS